MSFLVTGASGLLGGYLLEAVRNAGREPIGWTGTRRDGLRAVDLGAKDVVEPALDQDAPSVVIHAAAMTSVAACLASPDAAERINVEGTARLARACRARGTRFVFVSTDLVFDGTAPPYTEDAPPNPLSIYGRTKARAEQHVLAEDGLVVRAALLFGPSRGPRSGFFDAQLETLRTSGTLLGFEDERRTPASLAFAAEALVALALGSTRGIVHLGGPESMSRLVMARRLAALLGVDPERVKAGSRTHVPGEPRPEDTSFDVTRLRSLLPEPAMAPFEDECARMGVVG